MKVPPTTSFPPCVCYVLEQTTDKYNSKIVGEKKAIHETTRKLIQVRSVQCKRDLEQRKDLVARQQFPNVL